MLRMSESIIFDCKRRLLWLLVANWLATSRQLVAIVWQLVANQSPDAYLNMKTGIFLQIQDLADGRRHLRTNFILFPLHARDNGWIL